MVSVDCKICNQQNGAKAYFDYKKSPTIPDDISVNSFNDKKIYRCDSCESCFVHPSIDDKKLDSLYSSLYSRFPPQLNFYHRFFPYENYRYLSQVVYLKNFLNTCKQMQVLEIGSNITSVLPALSFLTNKIDFFYFDQVESPIIQKYGGVRIGSFAEPQAIREKIKENSLDLIYMSHTLEHLNPSILRKMLFECAHALKSKGSIFIEVPFQLELKNFYPPHTIFFSLKGLKLLFESIGFTIINVQLNNPSNSFSGPQNIVEKKYFSGIGIFYYLKKRMIQLLMIIFVQMPLIGRILHKLNFLSCVRNLKSPYDSRPFMRLLAQKSPT